MEITNVRASCHQIPVDVPLIDEPFSRPYVFVQVDTDEGLSGYGLTGFLYPLATKTFVNREISPIITGENPVETERIWHRMHKQLNPRDQTGPWSTAVSAVDIALWDIKGKYFGEPVWRLLGGAQNPVPSYVTFGLHEYSEQQLVEVAQDFVSQGETRLKMVVGRPEPHIARDTRRVAAVREAVGDDVELMIDANYKYPFNQVLELCNNIEQYDLTWFEEPVYGNDVDLLTDLRNRTRIPIAAGQNEGHRFRHRQLIANGAVDISQPNVCFVGGYTEGQKVAAVAQSYNTLIANGGAYPHHNMHLQAGMSNGWRVEFHYIVWKAGEAIYQDPPGPEGNQVTLTEDPGLGLEPDWDSLDRYEYE